MTRSLCTDLMLRERFRAMEEFVTEDKEAVIKLIDAMIVKNVEGAIRPFTQKAGYTGNAAAAVGECTNPVNQMAGLRERLTLRAPILATKKPT